jgi:hypothetical protein
MDAFDNWVRAIKADAKRIEETVLQGRGGPQSNKPRLIAQAMLAIANGGEFDNGGVFRQRTKSAIIVEKLLTSQADKLKQALEALNLPSVESITARSVGATVSITITLKAQP